MAAKSVKLDDELQTRLEQLAQQRKRTPHWVMRTAIKEYVEREEARDRFYQDALNAWQAYQENGLHLTGEEVSDWLKTWGTDEETEMPEWHA